jgi:hypothetical protein
MCVFFFYDAFAVWEPGVAYLQPQSNGTSFTCMEDFTNSMGPLLLPRGKKRFHPMTMGIYTVVFSIVKQVTVITYVPELLETVIEIYHRK